MQDIGHCDFLVQLYSVTWGGKNFCIIPYDSPKGLSEEWLKILNTYDPDTIISLTELDETTEHYLLDALLRHPTPRQKTIKNFTPQRIPVWNNPVLDAKAIHGLPLYSVLANIGMYNRHNEHIPALVPSIPPSHPLSMYIKARYGYMDENRLLSSSILSAGGLRWDLTLEDFIPVDRQLPSDFINFVINDEPSIHDKKPTFISLLDYTLTTLKSPWRDVAPNLLILSDSVSAEDFCWFWNLRAQYDYDSRLPIWLPKDMGVAILNWKKVERQRKIRYW